MNKTNRQDMKQKTDFNSWSINYLREIYQCNKCKKRNTIVLQSNKISQMREQKQFQNCLYCGNPNYV